MGLSKASIEEFKKIFKDEYGEDLEDDVAFDAAHRLVRFFDLIYKEVSKEDLDKIKTTENSAPYKEKKLDYVRHTVDDIRFTKLMRSRNLNVYIDIDGVLLTKDGQEAEYLEPFLDFFTKTCRCYWLTTHCKGDAQSALDYLKNKVKPELFKYLTKIKPTNWNTLKTEAIDFSKMFIWLDDYVMEAEKRILKENGREKNFLQVDLRNSPNSLLRLIKFVSEADID